MRRSPLARGARRARRERGDVMRESARPVVPGDASVNPAPTPSAAALTLGDLETELARLEARVQVGGAADARPALKDAIIELYRAVQAHPERTEALQGRVKALAGRWKSLGAPEPPASARVDHLGASTFLEKGWSRLSLGDASGGEAAIRRALELAPGSTDAQVLLGWTLMEQGRLDEAWEALQPVLAGQPEHPLALANVGFIRWRQRRYGDAIGQLSRVIALDADPKATLYAHLYLGAVYLEREMYDDARGFLRKAIALGPNLLQAHHELGRAHWFAGDRTEALAAWQLGAQTNKFNPWGKRCAQMLAAVERGEAPSREP